eukprot:gene12817-15041_t
MSSIFLQRRLNSSFLKFLAKPLDSSPTVQLQKELLDLQNHPPAGILIEEAVNFEKWVIILQGTSGSLYQGENFRLQFKFNSGYPLDSPDGPYAVI